MTIYIYIYMDFFGIMTLIHFGENLAEAFPKQTFNPHTKLLLSSVIDYDFI